MHGRVGMELAHQHYVGVSHSLQRLRQAEWLLALPFAELVVIEGPGRLALRRGGAGGQQQGQGEQGQSSSHGNLTVDEALCHTMAAWRAGKKRGPV
ncbi:hypothetical protein D3C86_1913880 [compost metagenome]